MEGKREKGGGGGEERGSALGLVGPVSVFCDWVICNFCLSVAARKLV